MNNKFAKIFAVVGFIVGGIWAAINNPYFIGIYDVGSFAGFIGGAIPLCLIASVLGYAIDKFAYKDSKLNDQTKTIESVDIEPKQNWALDDLYKQALNELEGGDRQAGLWAKCFADADGLENVAKAQYIKIRVSQLQLSIDQSTTKQLDLPSKSSSSPVISSPNSIKYIGAAFAVTLITIFGTLYGSGYYQDNKEKEQVKALEKLKERERQATTKREPPVRYEEKNYFQIEKELMTNITGSKKVMAVQLAVMTHYDSRVFDNIKKHQYALRSAMLDLMRQTTEAEASKPEFRKELAVKLKDIMNSLLEEYEDFGGIEEVLFTSFEML
jgi:flagellar FliL protein